MKNIILRVIACICISLFVVELYLALQGAEIKRLNYSGNHNEDERYFIEKIAGWGADSGKDQEDPRIKWRVWPNGMRECRQNKDKKTSFNVAFVGCSYTFGTGVEAKDTMVWLLNERYPNVTFDNYGCYGWGPVQMTARIEKLLNDKKYNLIVYNALPGHMMRNYGIKALGDLRLGQCYIPIPYGDHNIFGKYKNYYVNDLRWPLEDNLLTVDSLKRKYYGYHTLLFEEKYLIPPEASEIDCPELFAECINNMNRICQEKQVNFAVASLEDKIKGASGRFSVMDNPGIKCEIINLTMPYGESFKPYNRVLNNPSFHPNRNVHKYWAEKFSEWFDGRFKI